MAAHCLNYLLNSQADGRAQSGLFYCLLTPIMRTIRPPFISSPVLRRSVWQQFRNSPRWNLPKINSGQRPFLKPVIRPPIERMVAGVSFPRLWSLDEPQTAFRPRVRGERTSISAGRPSVGVESPAAGLAAPVLLAHRLKNHRRLHVGAPCARGWLKETGSGSHLALAWHFAALWGIWLGERKQVLAPSLVCRISLQESIKRK